MVKLKGPALSTEASGSLADALTFSHTKRRSYAKTHRKPKQPDTQPQLSVRAMIRFLSQEWKNLTPAQQATWEALAKTHDVYPYHAYIRANALRNRTCRTPSKEHPAAEASTPPPYVAGHLYAKVKSALCGIFWSTPYPTWGYIIFRDTTTFTTPKWYQTVKLITPEPYPITWWLDTPLETGTYYYRYYGFNDDGVIALTSLTRSVTIA